MLLLNQLNQLVDAFIGIGQRFFTQHMAISLDSLNHHRDMHLGSGSNENDIRIVG